MLGQRRSDLPGFTFHSSPESANEFMAGAAGNKRYKTVKGGQTIDGKIAKVNEKDGKRRERKMRKDARKAKRGAKRGG